MTSGRFHINGGESESSSSSASSPNATTNTTANKTIREGEKTELKENEKIRTFLFTSPITTQTSHNLTTHSAAASRVEEGERLEIRIPELLQSGYSFYTWPCAPILAWFLWERRLDLVNKRILELGSGTSLPGILAAKCGAQVTLSDNCILPNTLAHIRHCCLVNNLIPGQDIQIIGLAWGLLLNSVFSLDGLDLIIASDCFYDPTVFEDIIVTVSFLLDRNPNAKFIFTYQERSADWSIEALLKKWNLRSQQIISDDIGKSSGVDLTDILGGHTIHLIEITKTA